VSHASSLSHKASLTSRWYRGVVPKMPKKKCCSDKPACKRCPLRMMKEGTLPDGYTVKKRRLVKVDDKGKKSSSKSKAKVAA
jgi:hypothetical protein